MNIVYGQYKSRANKKGMVFELSIEKFKAITQKNCFYCGSGLSNLCSPSSANGAFHYNGIDRVDNMKGYELNNCVSCCSVCNRAKDIMSKDEFLNWIENVYKNSHRK